MELNGILSFHLWKLHTHRKPLPEYQDHIQQVYSITPEAAQYDVAALQEQT